MSERFDCTADTCVSRFGTASRCGDYGVISRRSALGVLGLGSIALLAGCKSKGVTDSKTKKLNIVASFYPMYDFAKKVAGDYADITCLVPAGTEPHDWEPSTKDMKTIQEADLLVYNGAGMEHWVQDVLDGLGKDTTLVAVEASQGIELRKLDEDEDEHDHEHDHEDEHKDEDDHDHEDDHEHGHGHDHGDTDPHVWLSPVNAIAEMKNICDALVKADSAHKDLYEDNFKKAQADFETLDGKYRKQLDPLPNKTIVVSHEAFGYMCDAYGLEQMPIEGVEADAEPNAQQMKEIADFVKEHNVKTIFSEELVSPKVAQAIADATGATVRELNPLEGLTDEQLKNGEDYISVMNANLKELVDALS